MRNIPSDSARILLNRAAIAVHQDPGGHMGIRLGGNTSLQVWAKTLTPSTGQQSKAAVALYNRGARAGSDITFKFADIPGFKIGSGSGSVPGSVITVTDVWSGRMSKVAAAEGASYTAQAVPLYDTAFVTIEV